MARAHRWKRSLESGRYGSLGAGSPRPEKIDRSSLGKTLRLTLLAPDIVKAILDGIAFVRFCLAVPGRILAAEAFGTQQRVEDCDLGRRRRILFLVEMVVHAEHGT